MKYKKIDYWITNLTECLNIGLLFYEDTSSDIVNAFQEGGHKRIRRLLIDNEIPALEQFEQFEERVIKNFKISDSTKGWSHFIRARKQDLRKASDVFINEIALAYFEYLPNINEAVATLRAHYYGKNLNELGEEIESLENRIETVVLPSNDEVIDKFRSALPGMNIDDLAQETVNNVKQLRDSGFSQHVIIPEKLSVAYACYVLAAVEQTVQFLETQLAIHDFQESSTPIKYELKKPKKEKLTWKQQLVLLDELHFLNTDVFKKVPTAELRARLIAHLLNLTEKDVCTILSRWDARKKVHKSDSSPGKYLITEKDEERIRDLLDECGLI